MGDVLAVSQAGGRRVGQQDVRCTPVQEALDPAASLERQRSQPHRTLRVLVRAPAIAMRAAAARDPQPGRTDAPAVDVQRAARRVTTSNDDEGFANAIERYVL